MTSSTHHSIEKYRGRGLYTKSDRKRRCLWRRWKMKSLNWKRTPPKHSSVKVANAPALSKWKNKLLKVRHLEVPVPAPVAKGWMSLLKNQAINSWVIRRKSRRSLGWRLSQLSRPKHLEYRNSVKLSRSHRLQPVPGIKCLTSRLPLPVWSEITIWKRRCKIDWRKKSKKKWNNILNKSRKKCYSKRKKRKKPN